MLIYAICSHIRPSVSRFGRSQVRTSQPAIQVEAPLQLEFHGWNYLYSLHLTCLPEEVDLLSGELWAAGTIGIRELDAGERITLIATFETNDLRERLLSEFRSLAPEWEQERAVDWVQLTHESWPPREIGERIFLAPIWSNDPTPPGRVRIVHNPGLACGTGEHPCTQLALCALEKFVEPGLRVIDVGTGSGLLAIAACKLGNRNVAGLDTDLSALQAARRNFSLNELHPLLIAGSVECLSSESSDLTIANINGTVLLSIFDDLRRITGRSGRIVLTGFNESELPAFLRLLPDAEVSAINEWRCITARIS